MEPLQVDLDKDPFAVLWGAKADGLQRMEIYAPNPEQCMRIVGLMADIADKLGVSRDGVFYSNVYDAHKGWSAIDLKFLKHREREIGQLFYAVIHIRRAYAAYLVEHQK